MDICDIARKRVNGVEVIEFKEKKLVQMTREQVEQNMKMLDAQIKDMTEARKHLDKLIEKFG